MVYSLAFIASQLADLLTFSLLPVGGEVNPIAATYPQHSVLLKAYLIAVIPLVRFGRYRKAVLLFGMLAGLVGAASNLSVIL